MILQALAFYAFSAVAVAGGVMVIAARNPVHSVLFLILAFFNGAALFVLLGAEFLAMILIVVYVGAIAVLFLFVVMMLNINFVELRQGFLQYLPVGALIGLVLLAELVLVGGTWVFGPEMSGAMPTPEIGDRTNTEALGDILYTQYIYLFQTAGIILLVAMIGAIVLTLRVRPDVRKQRPGNQIGRKREEAVAIRKVTPGSGV